MNREDIIRLAREAGFVLHAYPQENWLKLMERFAALVAAHEREACAKVVESRKMGASELMDAVRDMEAAAIRKRGEVKP